MTSTFGALLTPKDALPRIHIGDRADKVVEWMREHFASQFQAVSDVLIWLYDGLLNLLMAPHALVVMVAFGALAWLAGGRRNWGVALFSVAAFALIDMLDQWEPAMQTVALVLVSSALALLFAIPIGVAAAYSKVVRVVVRPVLDLMQTLPSFVYLIPVIFFFGIGEVPGIVATVVFAMPPGVRLTTLGIREVDSEVVEAGHAFGASSPQILSRIQLPLAMPTIMAGVNQVIMLSLSMVVIAGVVGAAGLGAVVYQALSALDVGLGAEAGLAVVLVAMYLDRLSESAQGRTARKLRT